MSNFDDFKRSLDQLVNQAQDTARLGLDVAKDQVEGLVRNPNLNDQMDEVRRNLQAMARDIETKAQELVHLASTYVQQGPGFPGASTGPARPSSGPQTQTPPAEPPTGGESATSSGAGTPQEGSNPDETEPTPAGEAPKQS